MRRNLRIFTFLFVFFIVVAVGSLMLLNGDTSVFNRNRDTIGAQTAVLTQTVIGEDQLCRLFRIYSDLQEPA